MFARKHLTSPRKIKATLVKRPVAFVIVEVNFHIIIVRTKNNFANCLRWLGVMSYAYPAPYKTGAGICTPNMLLATPDAESVFFVVRYTRYSMAWYVIQQQSYNRRSAALLSYHAAHNGTVRGCCVRLSPVIDAQNRIPRRQRMVTLAGLPKGRPVSSNAGSANPVNVTALIDICTSSGDSVNLLLEAA
ncbi:TPA: ash family protein [Salmonella enterica]|uniref:Ash family protein n=1 Tax=Salmonella enterica TaxID=28901 RepID=A0A743SQS9_SALER|nr:ash family protein [Salmonella enterica]